MAVLGDDVPNVSPRRHNTTTCAIKLQIVEVPELGRTCFFGSYFPSPRKESSQSRSSRGFVDMTLVLQYSSETEELISCYSPGWRKGTTFDWPLLVVDAMAKMALPPSAQRDAPRMKSTWPPTPAPPRTVRLLFN